MHVPNVGPRIVLVIVSTRTKTAREDIVEGLDKLTLVVLGVEEACFGVEEVAVVETALQVEVVILLAVQLLRKLCDTPVVIRCGQCNGHRLTILEAHSLLYGLLLARVERGEPTILVVELIKLGCGAQSPGNHRLVEHGVVHPLEGTLHVELDTLRQRISEDSRRVVTIHTVRVAIYCGECGHPASLAVHSDV